MAIAAQRAQLMMRVYDHAILKQKTAYIKRTNIWKPVKDQPVQKQDFILCLRV